MALRRSLGRHLALSAPLRFRNEAFHSAPGPTTCSCSCSFIRVTTTWASNTIWLPTSISGKCSTGRMHGLIIEDNRVAFCGCSRHAFFGKCGEKSPAAPLKVKSHEQKIELLHNQRLGSAHCWIC